MNETVLLEKFAPIGTIASLRVCRDIVSGRSLCYGYVNYQSYSDGKCIKFLFNFLETKLLSLLFLFLLSLSLFLFCVGLRNPLIIWTLIIIILIFLLLSLPSAERALATLNYEPLHGKQMRIMFSNRDPSARKSAVGNIFIKKLHPSVDSKSLHDTFIQFGRILSCKVCTDEKGESRGFGYVNFETEEAAHLAIEKVNGMIIVDMKVSVSKFVPKSERVKSGTSQSNFTNVFVKNLPESTSEDDVKNLFGSFGAITSSYLQRDSQGRPFAFINFSINEAALNVSLYNQLPFSLVII